MSLNRLIYLLVLLRIDRGHRMRPRVPEQLYHTYLAVVKRKNKLFLKNLVLPKIQDFFKKVLTSVLTCSIIKSSKERKNKGGSKNDKRRNDGNRPHIRYHRGSRLRALPSRRGVRTPRTLVGLRCLGVGNGGRPLDSQTK